MAASGTDALGAFGPQDTTANGGLERLRVIGDAIGVPRERFDVWGTL